MNRGSRHVGRGSISHSQNGMPGVTCKSKAPNQWTLYLNAKIISTRGDFRNGAFAHCTKV